MKFFDFNIIKHHLNDDDDDDAKYFYLYFYLLPFTHLRTYIHLTFFPTSSTLICVPPLAFLLFSLQIQAELHMHIRPPSFIYCYCDNGLLACSFHDHVEIFSCSR